jgi:hypothetical protein
VTKAEEIPDAEEVELVARGIATAVAPADGLTNIQADLLGAIANALTSHEVDYHGGLPELSPEELAATLADRSDDYRQRIVHHMVLGELVLRPLPTDVALRVATYASALGIEDKFVRVARRYAQGAYGLAWMDLRRSGFTEHWENAETEQLHTDVTLADPLERAEVDPQLEAKWEAFEGLDPDSLGRQVWEMYTGRGFPLPGSPEGASAHLAQHDFVHVLADYGTNLKGELEVFGLIGRADPDPRGFAWLATLIGLFETGYVADAGFFEGDTTERNIQAPGMHHRIADGLRRGKAVSQQMQLDLLGIDFHEYAAKPVEDVRTEMGVPPKSGEALESGSHGLFDLEGMSVHQQRVAAAIRRKQQ